MRDGPGGSDRLETREHGLVIKRDTSLSNVQIGTIQILGKTIFGGQSYISRYCIIGYPSEKNLKRNRVGMETRIGGSSLIRPFTIVYENVRIGSEFRTGAFVQVREGNRIGDKVSIGTHSVVERDCRIGDSVRIHSNCFISEYSVIEDDAWVGPCVATLNDKYPVTRKLIGPRIRRGAVVGANATILPGVVVGRKAVVAAGSLVTRDVPDESVVMGVPAKTSLKLNAYRRKQRKWKGLS